MPPLDKNLLREALRCRAVASSNEVDDTACASPKESKSKKKQHERRKDYGDEFARILYDYCHTESKSKRTGSHKRGTDEQKSLIKRDMKGNG